MTLRKQENLKKTQKNDDLDAEIFGTTVIF